MQRLSLFLLLFAGTLCLAGVPALAATPVYVTPDAPTDETVSGNTILPWDIARYDNPPPGYTPVFTAPGDPAIDAIHKLDMPGDWLFSVEAATDLAGSLAPDAFGSTAQQRDVVRYDSSANTYTRFFCGANVTNPVPDYANVDAVYVDGEDTADLIVSFDVPTTILGNDFMPSDLVRYVRSPIGGTLCHEWALAAAPFALNSSTITPPIPISGNVTGADGLASGDFILTFDVPTDLPAPATFERDKVVVWNGLGFLLYETLVGWPQSSEADGLSCAGNPGEVEDTLRLDKPASFPVNIELCWAPGCSDGGVEIGIYAGTIGTWPSHTAIGCTDTGGDNCELVVLPAGDRYYLIVPYNGCEGEGSYGRDFDFPTSVSNERAVGTTTCAPTQLITTCP